MKTISKRPSALPLVQQHGFTLLEVLVALTVVALALTALVKSSGSITANTAYLQEKNIAHWIAMNRIMALENEDEWPSKGTREDTVELLGSEWTWLQKVSDIPDYKDMRRVEVSVIRADGNEEFPLITLTSFFVSPNILSENNIGGSSTASSGHPNSGGRHNR